MTGTRRGDAVPERLPGVRRGPLPEHALVRAQTAVHTGTQARGYDVSEFEQQAQNIVNNMVHITGGAHNSVIAAA
ncbi:hypothetical protein GCM10020221_10530 [Streptomyces thioluteus]|uniref:Uncharacterized protein n=1 Tax=Streptomyces thioluteus TaxID=66431 RepID=A0ABN3WHP9_STRTU